MNFFFLGGLCFIIGVMLDVTFFVNTMDLFDSLETTFISLSCYLIFVYFLGMLISSIGSFMERLFLIYGLITRPPYEDYLHAEQVDPKIIILSSQASVFRNLTGMFIITTVFIMISELTEYIPEINAGIVRFIGFLVLALLSFFSWKKQVDYIKRRIVNCKK